MPNFGALPGPNNVDRFQDITVGGLNIDFMVVVA